MPKFTTVLDASLISVLNTQIANVNVRVMQDPLTDIQYPSLIPVNTNYATWQPSAAVLNLGEGYGEAQWITGYAKDVPQVELEAGSSSIRFEMFASGWKTNIQEAGQAAYAGFNITDAKARVARRKAEEFIDRVALAGDADKGYFGLAAQPNVAIISASTKAASGTEWVNNDGTLNATAAEIATDIVNAVLGPVSAANSLRPIPADTLALPSLAYRALASTFTDALNGGISYLEYINRQVSSVPGGNRFTIVEIPQLATAATTVINGGGRMIAYRRSLDILELPMPMPFQFLNEYKDTPLGYAVPGVGIIGGVTVWNTRGIRYMDGITPVPA